MKLIKLILIFFFLAAVPAQASDSIPIRQRLAEEQTALRQFFSLPFRNPAIKRYRSDNRLTEIAALCELERETEAVAIEEGDGRQIFGVDVRSYIPLQGSSLWGDASYLNGVKYNLKMNETSDAQLLYPYLTGDTIGGDIRSEIYAFSRGYAAENKCFTWGINAGFRATQEYRAIDPRPRNIASMLDLTLGAALHAGNNYLAGLALNLKKYKQNNEIAFYNELGDVKVYHYTGLSTDYARFRTKAGKSHYDGYATGLSLNLYPQRSGWLATVGYSRFNFEKVISSLNELNMLEMAEHSLEAEAGYRYAGDRHSAAFKLNAYSVRRKGTENIFGDESSNNYPWIAALEQYSRERNAIEAAALYERTTAELQWSLRPAAGYEDERERYTFPAGEISWQRATLALHCALSKTAGKFLLRTGAALKQHFPLQNTITLPETGIENYTAPALYRNHEYRSGKQTHFALDGRIDCAVNRNYALFAALQWQHGQYINNTTTNYITICCGINF